MCPAVTKVVNSDGGRVCQLIILVSIQFEDYFPLDANLVLRLISQNILGASPPRSHVTKNL
jgi:hypothetical protein